MKDLQKYYAEEEFLGDESQSSQDHCLYKQKDVDAVFAEIKQQHADFVLRLQAEHAEEIERLTHDFKNFHRLLCDRFGYVHDERDWKRDQISLIEHIAVLNKQAERYEKLRRMSVPDFALIRQSAFRGVGQPMYEAIDALVDQLPASGEAQP